MEVKLYNLGPFKSYNEQFNFLISLYKMVLPMKFSIDVLDQEMHSEVIKYIHDKIRDLKFKSKDDHERYKTMKNKLLEVVKEYDADNKLKIISWRYFYRY